MSLLTPTTSKKPIDRQKIILIVTIILSLVIGITVSLKFGDVPAHAMHDNILEPRFIRGGLASAVTMLIGGIISGFSKSKNNNEEIFA